MGLPWARLLPDFQQSKESIISPPTKTLAIFKGSGRSSNCQESRDPEMRTEAATTWDTYYYSTTANDETKEETPTLAATFVGPRYTYAGDPES